MSRTDGYEEFNGVQVRLSGRQVGNIIPNENGDYFEVSAIHQTMSCPTINLDYIRARTFPMFDEQVRLIEEDMENVRVQIGHWPLTRIHQDIMAEEDSQVFQILDDIAQPCNIIVDGYWVEHENQGRDDCLFCDCKLKTIKDGNYKVCSECDKK